MYAPAPDSAAARAPVYARRRQPNEPSVQGPDRGALERRLGFTLIELLVVVSIIALLIGILLPTLSEARRQAGIVACVATIRSNAQGTASFTADNQDRLPSAPEGDGNQNGPTTGERGRPAQNFANQLDRGLNGFQFTAQERETPAGILFHTIPPTQTARGIGIEGFWFVAFGNYMVEGRGDAMLQEPFVSPTDRGRKNAWNEYRNTPREQRNDVVFLRSSTYWYVTPRSTRRSSTRTAPSTRRAARARSPRRCSPSACSTAAAASPSSNKVAYYQQAATHDRGVVSWNQGGPGTAPNGTATSVASSTAAPRACSPSARPGLPDPPDVDDTSTVRPLPAAFGPGPQLLSNQNQFFRFTFGGLSGRDLP